MSADVAPAVSRPELSFATRLFSASAILMGAKACAAGLALLTYWLLTQTLEPSAFGIFLTALSLVVVAGSVATLGYPSVTARFNERYKARSNPQVRAAFLKTARRDALAVALAATILMIAVAWIFVPAWGPLVTVMAWMVPLIALLRINGALAIAERKPLLGYLPEMLGRPLLFATALVAVFMTAISNSLILVATSALFSVLLACLLQAWAVSPLRHATSSQGSERSKLTPTKRHRAIWLSAALPLVPTVLVVALFPDTVLLTSASALSPADLAILGVNLKIAFLVGFIVQVTIQIAQPELAVAITRCDTKQLRAQTLLIAVLNVGVVAIATTIAAFIGDELLTLFGSHYAAGAELLVWLCALQLLRVPGAIAVQILILKGRSRDVFFVMTTAFGTLVLSVLVFSQVLSLAGTAFAIALTFAVMSLVSAWKTRRFLLA